MALPRWVRMIFSRSDDKAAARRRVDQDRARMEESVQRIEEGADELNHRVNEVNHLAEAVAALWGRRR